VNAGILKLADLLEILGFEHAGQVERCLRQQGIRYFHGKGGAPWTTIDLIDQAGGLNPRATSDNGPYSPDICQ
jgi:hypothetical protein